MSDEKVDEKVSGTFYSDLSALREELGTFLNFCDIKQKVVKELGGVRIVG